MDLIRTLAQKAAPIARELLIVLAAVVAAEMILSFDSISADPSALLSDPKSFVIGLGVRIGPKLVMALSGWVVLKLRGLLASATEVPSSLSQEEADLVERVTTAGKPKA